MKNRVPLIVLLVVVLGGVAYLLKDTLLKPSGSASNDGPATDAAQDAASNTAKDAAGTEPDSARLASGADPAGRGAVTVRLLDFRDKHPIAGQAVRLLSSAGERLERATGEDGRVLFSGLKPANDWILTVEGVGFSPVEMRGVAIKAKRLPLDLGDLLLGEKVALRGRVLDGKGLPVPGASVSAFTGGGLDFSKGMVLAMVSDVMEMPSPQEEAKTDEKGLFVLASLSPGTYRLSTKHPGYGQDLKPDLIIASGRATGVLTIVLGSAATLRGKVTDDAGAPVVGATVMAIEDVGQRMRSTTIKKDYTVTGADGRYVMDTLNRGTSYRLGVSAKGRAPLFFDANSTTMEVEATRDFTLVRGGAIAGTVTDAATGKPIAGAKVLAITGTLGMGPRGGGRGGRGGGGAPASGPPADASTQTATTGDDGTFRLEGLKPGAIAIGQVKAHGYADLSVSSFNFGPPQPNAPAQWGEVKAGETTTVDVKLEAGGSVTGKVTTPGPNGAVPVQGAVVSVLAGGFGAIFSGYPTAVTGEDGSYRAEGVKPGSVGIGVTAPGFVSVLPNLMDPSGQLTMPDAGGVLTHDVSLSAAGSVEGVVANSKGAPVSGARVRTKAPPASGTGARGMGTMMRMLLSGSSGGVVLTDADGRYRIDGVSGEDKFVVEAESEEYVPGESEPFEVKAGETAKANVVLQGGATMRGRVIDDHGRIVVGAALRVGTLDDETDKNANLSGFLVDRLLDSATFSSDTEGFYEITKIKPGKTLLKVECEGYSTFYRRDLVFQPDQVLENYSITVVKGETISGVVRGDDGKTIAGAFVAVTRQGNPTRMGGQPDANAPASDGTVEPQMSDRTDDQGRFTVENVPPGTTYSVVVWFAQGYRGFAMSDDAAIKRGVTPGTRDVELILKKADPADSISGFGGMPMPRPPARPPTPVPAGPAMGAAPGMGG